MLALLFPIFGSLLTQATATQAHESILCTPLLQPKALKGLPDFADCTHSLRPFSGQDRTFPKTKVIQPGMAKRSCGCEEWIKGTDSWLSHAHSKLYGAFSKLV